MKSLLNGILWILVLLVVFAIAAKYITKVAEESIGGKPDSIFQKR